MIIGGSSNQLLLPDINNPNTKSDEKLDSLHRMRSNHTLAIPSRNGSKRGFRTQKATPEPSELDIQTDAKTKRVEKICKAFLSINRQATKTIDDKFGFDPTMHQKSGVVAESKNDDFTSKIKRMKVRRAMRNKQSMPLIR